MSRLGVTSKCGSKIACISPDGGVIFWDAFAETIVGEFSSADHLSNPMLSIDWLTEDLLCFGTKLGSVCLLDASRLKVVGDPLVSHTNAVRGLAVRSQESFFSGGGDGQIVEWSLNKRSKGRVEKKWSAGKKGISALGLIENGSKLVSASTSGVITVWNTEDCTALHKVTGHVNPVSHLVALSPSKTSDEKTLKKRRKSEFVAPSLFFTAAQNERNILAWNLASIDGSFLTLASTENVCHLSVGLWNSDAIVSVVTDGGSLLLYRFSPGTKQRKPVVPSKVVKFLHGEGQSLIPVRFAVVREDGKILVIRGDFAKPSMEMLEYDDLEEQTQLIRAASSRRKKSKVSTQPVVDSPKFGVSVGLKAGLKREAEVIDPVQKSLGERLQEVELHEDGQDGRSGQSLTRLLVQGLQSKDKSILRQVLSVDNEATMKNTLRRLPAEYVTALLKVLAESLSTGMQPEQATTQIRWVKNVLFFHTSALASNPNVDTILAPFLKMREESEALLRKFSEVKGRFDMVFAFAEPEDLDKETDREPVFVLNDDDSDWEEKGLESSSEHESDLELNEENGEERQSISEGDSEGEMVIDEDDED
ncbi:unnamed protein product [Notodromas monacha]|uniref:Small-subunit processome Utp12 domain-containing protein n=1 Tax=Notodromas monacha TaxID=399045 RepID=A0A7R9GFE8_9CRUS|nr:unnamed protein product [Notodromas monacha]CAG0918760.1 unnamed protein product [Notodromas monacha]